jgi:hypothetical protein
VKRNNACPLWLVISIAVPSLLCSHKSIQYNCTYYRLEDRAGQSLAARKLVQDTLSPCSVQGSEINTYFQHTLVFIIFPTLDLERSFALQALYRASSSLSRTKVSTKPDEPHFQDQATTNQDLLQRLLWRRCLLFHI